MTIEDSSQKPTKNLFPKLSHSSSSQEAINKPEGQEVEAWDRFFSKMTRKVIRPVNEADILFPKKESANPDFAPSNEPAQSLPLKPKTEKLNLRPALNQPITSRFKPINGNASSTPITSRFKPVISSQTPIKTKTTKLTSLVNPTGEKKHDFQDKEPFPTNNVTLSETTTTPKVFAQVPSEEDLKILDSVPLFQNNIPSNAEPFEEKLSPDNLDQIPIFQEEIPKKEIEFPPLETIASSEATPSKSLFDRFDEIEAEQAISFPEQKKAPHPVFSPKQLISPQVFLKYSLFISPESERSQLRCCSVCTQMMPDAKVFTCERCQEYSCLTHRKGLFWCETCFLKVNHFHPFFDTVVEHIKNQELKGKAESSGAVTSEELYSIFRTLSFLLSSEGLIVLGNSQFKRGICFLGEQVLFVNFGTTNIVALGTLLKQNGLISEGDILSVLDYQKKYQVKFGEAVVGLRFVTEEVLAVLLNEQVFREILAISRWPESNYKFRPGKVPAEMLQKMYIDTKVALQVPSEFKQILSVFFHHMIFIKTPGLLQLQSSAGSIAFLTYQNQFELANFKPDAGYAFGAYLVQIGKISQTELEIAQQQAEYIEDYFIEQGIFVAEQLQEYLRAYIGQELQKILNDPQMKCRFYEGEATEKNLEGLFLVDTGLNLFDLFYDIVARLEQIPSVLSSEEIFTLVFDKNSSDKIVEVLYQKIHQDLDFTEISPRLTGFEKGLIHLIWVKSYLVHYAKTLKQHKEILLQNNQASLAQSLLESLKHI